MNSIWISIKSIQFPLHNIKINTSHYTRPFDRKSVLKMISMRIQFPTVSETSHKLSLIPVPVAPARSELRPILICKTNIIITTPPQELDKNNHRTIRVKCPVNTSIFVNGVESTSNENNEK